MAALNGSGPKLGSSGSDASARCSSAMRVPSSRAVSRYPPMSSTTRPGGVWSISPTSGRVGTGIAAGGFNDHGWFLQRYGGGWRWHLAPVSCAGGRPVLKNWTHLVGTFDGSQACLYQDGKLVAQAACVPNRVPYRGPLVLGQYTTPGPSYQVQGALRDVQLYARALRPAEIAENFRTVATVLQ